MSTDELIRNLFRLQYGDEPIPALARNDIRGLIELTLYDLRRLCDDRGFSFERADAYANAEWQATLRRRAENERRAA